MIRDDTPEWRHDGETGEDVWLTQNKPTIAQVATIAGSKDAIAKACGVSPRTVGYWRSGEREPSFSQVRTMAKMASVSLESIR